MLNVDQDKTGMERLLAFLLLPLLLLACMSLTWQFSQEISHMMLAGISIAVLMSVALVAPRVAITLCFIYMAIQGDIRRIATYLIGVAPAADPLLLIGPVTIGTLFAVLFLRAKTALRPGLSRLIALLFGLMAIQVFNPIQGGLTVGLTGAMIYMTPLMCFWVGRYYGDHQFSSKVFYTLVPWVGFAGALLGLYQTFVDFLPYQWDWIDRMKAAGYFYIIIGTGIRPFGFFVSPAEFAHYCMLLVVLGGAPLLLRRWSIVSLLVPLAVACILFQAGRGALLFTGVAGVAMWSAVSRTRSALETIARLAVGTGCLAAALYFGLSAAVESDLGVITPMVERHAEGLLNATDSDSSAAGHVNLVIFGLTRTLTESPWGRGLGIATSASKSSDAITTEMDFSDMFVALGVVGGVLYLVIIAKALYSAAKLTRAEPNALNLAILGILVSQLMHWLNAGHYAVAALVWFTLGVLDRRVAEHEQAMRELA